MAVGGRCILQMYNNCSDEEAVERTKFDDCWKVALDLEPEERPFAKSTLQEFRAKVLLNEAVEKVFIRVSLDAARAFNPSTGPAKVVLDTTPILGRGAVKDTYNLIADGIKNLARTLSHCIDEKLAKIIARHSLAKYFSDKSLKGGAGIDWTNDEERRQFLNILVDDARSLLAGARPWLERVSEKRSHGHRLCGRLNCSRSCSSRTPSQTPRTPRKLGYLKAPPRTARSPRRTLK